VLSMISRSGIGYPELRKAFQTFTSNCTIRSRRSNIHRKLLEACIRFTKSNGRILSITVIRRLRVAFRELRIVNTRVRILSEGKIKALEMQVQYRRNGVFKWVPRLEDWLTNHAYRYWLGTMQVSLIQDDLGRLAGSSQNFAES
jgi:hypothetical protein